jgi:hypothetical protein
MKGNFKSHQACLFYACIAVIGALLWQLLSVHYNFGGNWTGLFCTGSYGATPPALAFEHIYRFADSEGYDGQFYHYIAHDPLLKRGMSQYVDNPRLRWRRILLPGLAYLFALGQDEYIDAAYVAVNLGFLLLGVYWLARFVTRRGWHPAWGLAFFLVPATPISIDRMTVDMALVALCIGYVVYVDEGPLWKLLLVLILAPLARETGFCLAGGACLYFAARRHWRRAVASALSITPFLAWVAFVSVKTSPDATAWFSWLPFEGLVRRTVHPFLHAVLNWKVALAAGGDYLGILGMWPALAIAFSAAWKRRSDGRATALYLFICVAAFVARDAVWEEAYSFGRIMSPLMVLTALDGVADRSWWRLLPMVMVLPRVGMQFGFQALNILRHLRVL